MKLLGEYLEHALQFERLAADEDNLKLKAQLEGQARAYRKLAAERATKLGLPAPSVPTLVKENHRGLAAAERALDPFERCR